MFIGLNGDNDIRRYAGFNFFLFALYAILIFNNGEPSLLRTAIIISGAIVLHTLYHKELLLLLRDLYYIIFHLVTFGLYIRRDNLDKEMK